MYRKKIEDLKRWKESKNRKPLIIRGARQVGKSWLVREFGNTCYEKYVEVNFEDQPLLNDLFVADFDVNRILSTISAVMSVQIDSETLLFFDEIQSVPRGLMAMKYLYEKASHLHIIAAGSLLGIELHPGDSFPVGKVDFLDLSPMTFVEFLMAIGENGIALQLEKANVESENDWGVLNILHNKCVGYLKTYYYVGGMPEAVRTFVESNRDWKKVREVQSALLRSYKSDFSKHADAEIVRRMNMVWDSIPAQLSKENRKFVFGVIRQGARASQFETAIDWIVSCGLLLKSVIVSKPSLPLNAYERMSIFKLYLLDVGLLSALLQLPAATIFDGDKVFTEFKGALTEQFVAQEIYSHNPETLHYWADDSSTAEIDFILQKEGDIIPIEAKAAKSLSAKSFTNYVNKYEPRKAIKTSELPYKNNGRIINLPLYAVGRI